MAIDTRALQHGTRPEDISRLRDRDETYVRRAPMDLPFFLLVLLLLSIGVIMVLSASFASAFYNVGGATGGNPTFFFFRQLIFAVSGIGLMLIASQFPTGFYQRMSLWSLLIALFLLVLVLIVGAPVNNARRWINVAGVFTFQPSEMAKLAVVLVFAQMICKYKEQMKTFKYGVLPFALVMGMIVALLMFQPHISASVIILLTGVVMMFLGGTRLYWFLGGAVVVGVLGYVVVTQLGYASARIDAWLDPFANPQHGGWQIIQSLYAIGSGGALGLGLGQSRQKYLYLPEEHNDYIFAIVAEELGFVGGILILALFAILIVRGYWIALHARTKYGSLIAAGLTSLLAIQVFLNIGVVTNLLPATGISLPFFSYGGTALWFKLISMGIILAVSREIPAKRAG